MDEVTEMHAMNNENLDKVEKALDICYNPKFVSSCEGCPYYKSDDNVYSCTGKMYEDIKEVIAWSREALDVIPNLLGKLGSYPGFTVR